MTKVRFGTMALGTAALALAETFACAVLGLPNLPSLVMVFAISVTYCFAIGVPSSLILPPLMRAMQGVRLLYRVPLAIVSGVAVAVPCSFLGTSILVCVGIIPAAERWTRGQRDARIAILIAIAIGIATLVYSSFRERLKNTQLELKNQELARARAEQLASEAQFASLASRLQPHFLFNTLNSISSLIQTDPLRAERILGRLAALLRASLDSRTSELVSLHHELKLVADYLEIQHVRYPERLRYHLQVPPALLDQRVPPFAIQTLVENAVKFAVAPSAIGCTIRVVAGLRDGRLCIEVWDDGPGFSADRIPPNHGLDNLRARLLSIYADAARLTITREAFGGRGFDRTRVAVELPVLREVAE